MNSTLALISGLGLGLGLETSGLGLSLGLGLETPEFVIIPVQHWLYNIILVSRLTGLLYSAPARELIPGSRNPGIWTSHSWDFLD